MHNPEFTIPSAAYRGVLVCLAICFCSVFVTGCQPQPEPPSPAPETAPAAVEPAATAPPEVSNPPQADASAPPPRPTAADTVEQTQTAPKETLRLQPPPAREKNDAPSTPSNGTIDIEPPAEQAADTTESPNAGDTMEEDDYEIDPEILAHIKAQERAIRRIADTYAAPPGAKQLGKQADLWVDMKAKRVYIDGYVAMRRGPLEMFACPVGTKEHESVVAVFAKSSEVHAALLAIGAQSGTPVRWNPEFLPPTGQTITVWATWRSPEPSSVPEKADEEEPSNAEVEFVPGEEFHAVDAREWVRNMKTKTQLDEPWVFAGSTFWSDPEDNVEHYSADAGDMICVSNFSSAMLDVPFNSSADAGNLLFEPFSENIPERGTPVRLVLVPQPIPSDEPPAALPVDPTTPPDKSMLPIANHAAPKAADAKE